MKKREPQVIKRLRKRIDGKFNNTSSADESK
jgi:hypothetical protein